MIPPNAQHPLRTTNHDPSTAPAGSAETQAGAVLGTPSSTAPEQASGNAHAAGPAAGIYALGAILYKCLTGQPPFKGKTIVETLDQVRTREPVPPAHWQNDVGSSDSRRCRKKHPRQVCESTGAESRAPLLR
jgi:serine/threonine protein kinase